MKVIKPFFLGVIGGLVLSVALLLGLFFSPIREDLYFRLDPEMADIRSKLGQYQEWLSQTDLRIAGSDAPSAAPTASDSLRNAQTRAWRDYKGWRNRLGELARTQVHPTAEGFWPWIHSLRFWILPIGALLCLLPGILLAWRGAAGLRRGRKKSPGKSARAQALSNFEDAIKKVARISETGRGHAAPAVPAPVFPGPADQSHREPPTDAISASIFRDAANPILPVLPKKKEPDTVPLPLVPEAEDAKDPGRETSYMERGPGWGDSISPPGERIGGSAPGAGLSMEDEDASEAGKSGADAGEGEETLGVMPPTTEVERVERRKAEVLKLARKGMTSSEISRRLRISQDQVEFIIRLRREKG